MLTLFSIGAYAQTQQGQSSFGFNLGYNFNDVGNATIGIDYRYCVTDAFRLTPSITHLVKNDGLSAWAIDMNAHYVFKLSEMFGFYPLAGLSLSFWKAGPWDATRFGANIGLGGEVYATDRVSSISIFLLLPFGFVSLLYVSSLLFRSSERNVLEVGYDLINFVF